MLWDSVNDPCDVCGAACSGMLKTGFNMSGSCCNNCRHDACHEKENMRQNLGNSPLKNESDLSLYGTSSPERRPCHGSSLSHCTYRRRPLEDHDANSRDSGYEANCSNDGNKFYQFAQSLGVTPRQECSPAKSCILSFGSMESMDAEFLELSDIDQPMDESVQLPSEFNALVHDSLVGPPVSTKEISPVFELSCRPPLRRSMSLTAEGQTPNSSRVRSCLFKTGDSEFRPFKRPDPPADARSPVQNKRSRVVEESEGEEAEEDSQLAAVPEFAKPVLRRSVSATEESIKYALQRSSTEPDLIGDFSKAFCLPLITGRHQDLKSITPNTLALLMRGEFTDSVASYKVIDCRYPYEFDGGHVNGALNWYTKDQILENLLNMNITAPTASDACRRNILVFHCEFSSERGPNLCRFLRNLDRIRNKDVYPALHYPEVYLLDGGYKCFYEQYSELCIPVAYKPMLDPAHSNDLRFFRSKSKTWNADRTRTSSRGNLKRLGLI